MRLLPEEVLIKTGDVDHANWNYVPLLGTIQRLRFRLICSLLGEQRYGRILEIGYGSGVFMPELSTRCDELYGIDPHGHPTDVEKVLSQHGVSAKLRSASAEAMPFEDSFFDAIVAVSSLEFIPDLEKACCEIRRILKPTGVVIFVTPGHSVAVDLGLRILTGKDPGRDFADRREGILPCLARHFRVERRIDSLPLIHRLVRIYSALRMSLN